MDDSSYGNVWIPRSVPSGWAPYRTGHWAYEQPWGWTWIDDQPWGFAPFHYGRWVNLGGASWGWVPGPIVVRPVYAPAVVGFVGGGGFGFGFGNVGWVPLAPYERFHPWWGRGYGGRGPANRANAQGPGADR